MKLPFILRSRSDARLSALAKKLVLAEETIANLKASLASELALRKSAETVGSRLELELALDAGWFSNLNAAADYGRQEWHEKWKAGRARRLLHISLDDSAGSGYRWIRTLNASAQYAARGVVFRRNRFQFPHDILLPPLQRSSAAEDFLRRLINEADLVVIKHLPEYFGKGHTSYLASLLPLLRDCSKVVPHFFGSWHRSLLDDESFKSACANFKAIAFLTPDLAASNFPNFVWIPHALPYSTRPPFLWKPETRWLIGHSPSKRNIKGTDLLVSQVNLAQDLKIPWNLKLLENLTSEEVRHFLPALGVFFDQAAPHFSEGGVGVGWYGNAALEAAAIGIPTACYLYTNYFAIASTYSPDWTPPPFFNVSPTEASMSDFLSTVATLSDQELHEKALETYEWTNYFHGDDRIVNCTDLLFEKVVNPSH